MGKKYKCSEESKIGPSQNPEENKVEEPALTYYASQSPISENPLFAERKAELINAIQNDVKDDEVLSELEVLTYTTIYGKNAPCQYSVEELKKRIEESIKQVEEGNYYTHEEVKEMFKKWN
ncbi:MAG: hypothetical protein LUG51_03980 [Tannerellaceae bacterium]|nr:hypothetical protein [Tannerellaceae bacterium]